MKADKILLLRPPLFFLKSVGFEEPHPPIELACLGSQLGKGHDVVLCDAFAEGRTISEFDGAGWRVGLSDAEIVAAVKKAQPDVIGISAMWTNQKRIVDHVARLLKSVNPEWRIVVGGNLPSAVPEEMLRNPAIDYVIVGEGDEAFVRLLEDISQDKARSATPGVAYRDGDRVVGNGRATVTDLDGLPSPAYDLFKLDAYAIGYSLGRLIAPRFMGMLASRGCSYGCKFCCLHNVGSRRFRHAAVDKVIGEMELLKNKYGVGEIQFYDYNLLNDPVFAKALFREIRRARIDVPWVASPGLSVWELDDEMLELAISSGMYRMDLPIESASDETRSEVMGKSVCDIKRVKKIISRARELGIRQIGAYIIVGCPGESKESIKKSLFALNQLDLDVRIVKHSQPYPGTEFFEVYRKHGNFAEDFSYDRLWFSMANTRTREFSADYVQALVQADKTCSLMKRGMRGLTASLREVIQRYGWVLGLRTLFLLVGQLFRYRNTAFSRPRSSTFVKCIRDYELTETAF